jgi:hypothetical protein
MSVFYVMYVISYWTNRAEYLKNYQSTRRCNESTELSGHNHLCDRDDAFCYWLNACYWKNDLSTYKCACNEGILIRLMNVAIQSSGFFWTNINIYILWSIFPVLLKGRAVLAAVSFHTVVVGVTNVFIFL